MMAGLPAERRIEWLDRVARPKALRPSPLGDACGMSETPRGFKLPLKNATDLYVPPTLRSTPTVRSPLAGVGFLAEVQPKTTAEATTSSI